MSYVSASNKIMLKRHYALVYLYNKHGELVGKTKVTFKDLSKIRLIRWHLDSSGYAKNKVVGLMHRFILNAPKGKDVDHKNHKTLDNRRRNLRICSHTENQRNLRIGAHNTSGAKGVTWRKDKEKWVARIQINGKVKHLGYFDEVSKAAIAYNTAAKKYFKEFASLN